MTQTIHTFFRDGRADALSEVRILQHSGQWTKEKRASWMKEAESTYTHLKHSYPRKEGTSYFTGRISALKSRLTLDFSSDIATSTSRSGERTIGSIVYRPLPAHTHHFCGLFDCGSDALWGVSIFGDGQIFLALCDPCRQEWVRTETVYTTADGWDWDGDEDSYGVATLEESYPSLVGWCDWKQADCTLEVICVLLALFLGASINTILGLLVAQLLLAALITRLVLDERKDPPQ